MPRRSDAARRTALGLIGRAVFVSDDHAEPSRADAYRQLATPQARMKPLAEPFRAHAVVYSLGDVRIGLFEGVPHSVERDQAKIAFDGVDGIAFQHLVSGRTAGSFDGRDAAVEEGGVYGVDMARPAAIEEEGAIRSIRVDIRRRTAAEILPALDGLHGATLDRRAAESYLHVLHGFVPRLDALPAADAPRHVAELLGALAGCLERAIAPRDAPGEKRGAMLDFIDRNLADRRLAPDFIAGSLRISRTTLFSAFRDWGGVERAIVQRRLDRAHMILLQSGPRPSVARLAHQCGFSSPEHFSRVFRQRYGSSPSRYSASGDRGGPPGE